jgi:sugar phosphate isomerase/epimerase
LLGSSLCLTKAAPGDVEKVIELAELAAQLRAPYLRVFGSGDPNIAATKEALKSAAKLVRELRTEIARHGWKVELLLETHDAFCTSARCHALIEVLDEPLAILWDSHHTWRLGSETIEQTWGELGPLIRHVHYKDSTAQPDTDMGYGYVLPGEGEFPTQALFRLLKTEGYPRGVSLEWEKLWHPKLAPMEVALTAFLKVIKKNT